MKFSQLKLMSHLFCQPYCQTSPSLWQDFFHISQKQRNGSDEYTRQHRVPVVRSQVLCIHGSQLTCPHQYPQNCHHCHHNRLLLVHCISLELQHKAICQFINLNNIPWSCYVSLQQNTFKYFIKHQYRTREHKLEHFEVFTTSW